PRLLHDPPLPALRQPDVLSSAAGGGAHDPPPASLRHSFFGPCSRGQRDRHTAFGRRLPHALPCRRAPSGNEQLELPIGPDPRRILDPRPWRSSSSAHRRAWHASERLGRPRPRRVRLLRLRPRTLTTHDRPVFGRALFSLLLHLPGRRAGRLLADLPRPAAWGLLLLRLGGDWDLHGGEHGTRLGTRLYARGDLHADPPGCPWRVHLHLPAPGPDDTRCPLASSPRTRWRLSSLCRPRVDRSQPHDPASRTGLSHLGRLVARRLDRLRRVRFAKRFRLHLRWHAPPKSIERNGPPRHVTFLRHGLRFPRAPRRHLLRPEQPLGSGRAPGSLIDHGFSLLR